MQESLHEDPYYGVASQSYAPLVAAVIAECGAGKVLDYGSGKGRLREAIADHLEEPVEIEEYDPAIPGKDSPPDPCELVVCIDVLEHIEPDCLESVLDDLHRVTERFGFFTVDCGKAGKFLPDGRNAHLIQQPMEWWLPRLWERFRIHSFARTEGGFWLTCMKNPDYGA